MDQALSRNLPLCGQVLAEWPNIWKWTRHAVRNLAVYPATDLGGEFRQRVVNTLANMLGAISTIAGDMNQKRDVFSYEGFAHSIVRLWMESVRYGHTTDALKDAFRHCCHVLISLHVVHDTYPQNHPNASISEIRQALESFDVPATTILFQGFELLARDQRHMPALLTSSLGGALWLANTISDLPEHAKSFRDLGLIPLVSPCIAAVPLKILDSDKTESIDIGLSCFAQGLTLLKRVLCIRHPSGFDCDPAWVCQVLDSKVVVRLFLVASRLYRGHSSSRNMFPSRLIWDMLTIVMNQLNRGSFYVLKKTKQTSNLLEKLHEQGVYDLTASNPQNDPDLGRLVSDCEEYQHAFRVIDREYRLFRRTYMGGCANTSVSTVY